MRAERSPEAGAGFVARLQRRGKTAAWRLARPRKRRRLALSDLSVAAVDGYDADGNLTSVTHYNGSKLAMTYDALNRATQVIETLPDGRSFTLNYSYDADGNRTGMSTPWGNFVYTYDALNRETSVTNPQNEKFSFSYDADGRRISLSYPNGVQTSYGYDAAGQLLQIIR
jgi:YD repeat-containing protein